LQLIANQFIALPAW